MYEAYFVGVCTGNASMSSSSNWIVDARALFGHKAEGGRSKKDVNEIETDLDVWTSDLNGFKRVRNYGAHMPNGW